MQWSPQQDRAMSAVRRWLRKKDQQVFRLFGYAGTGKTTLARHLADDAGHVLFGAFTGKAASVMREKECYNAKTIHQLIYVPTNRSKDALRVLEEQLEARLAQVPEDEQDDDARIKHLRQLITVEENKLKKPAFTLNDESPVHDADLVVIDECSMVGDQMGFDLMSFDKPILVLGDPAQLPPVYGGGYFTDREPDFLLTEVHRQARNNPVLDMATRIRQGEHLEEGAYGNSVVMSGKPTPEMVRGADQILVGRNATRRKCNFRMRELLGYGREPTPVVGDKLVCLRNDHEVGLLNGTIWTVRGVETVSGYDRIGLTVTDDQTTMDVECHTHYFEGREQELPHWIIREAQCFDFGYALTGHKSQGSQWDNVFIFDESYVFKGHRNRWLYTAVTRAAKKVTICR